MENTQEEVINEYPKIDKNKTIIKKKKLTKFDVTLMATKNAAKVFGSLILTPISPFLAQVALGLSIVSIVKTSYKFGNKAILNNKNTRILSELAEKNGVSEDEMRIYNFKTKKASKPVFAPPGRYIDYIEYEQLPPENQVLYSGVIVSKDDLKLIKMRLILKKNEETKLGKQLENLRKEVKIKGYSLAKETNLQLADPITDQINLDISEQS